MKMAAAFVDQNAMDSLWLIEVRLFDEELRLHICANLEADVLRTRASRW